MDVSNHPTIPQEKKPFPEDRALKLAMAREKALEVRRKNSLARKKAELEKLENKVYPPIPEGEPDPYSHLTESQEPPPPPEEPPPPDPPEPVEEETPPPPKPVKKKTKRQMVVVEQSSEDSDEFEPTPNVVFVKRVRKKKDPPQPPPQPSPQPAPPPIVRQEPQMTPEQLQLQNLYNGMFSGQFLGGRRR